MRSIAVLSIVASFLLHASQTRAQDLCGACDHTVTPGPREVNGEMLGVGPGDVVCVMAGEYEFIRFQHIQGSEGDPVVITNCGGAVNVRNTTRAYAIIFEADSRHFHMTGTGTEGVEYGFTASCPDVDPWPGVGLWMQGRSTNYEIDHVEVFETGFAGVMSKTDPLCDGSADQDVFVQRDVRLHHLYVHDTGGEGFYVGSTQSAGHEISCDGMQEVHQPHFLEGIEIDHVIVENTGWDGMQVGMAREGCSVHDNVIRNVGLDNELYQTRGLQVGTFSACDVRRNTFERGPTIGVFVLHAADTTVSDNVVVDFEEDAIYANLGDQPPATYRFVHNTIARFGGAAIRIFGPDLEDVVAWNNLVIGPPNAIGAGGDVDFEAEGNAFYASESEAGLYGSGDYHLLETSPARGAGIDRSGAGFTLDRDGRERPNPPAVGAYEFSADAPFPTGSDGGCGCATAGARDGERGPAGTWLAALGALASARLRRRISSRRAFG